MLKQCKKIYNACFGWTGIRRTHNEKIKNSDPEIRQFIRSKRLPKNLPDSFTDTKWIKRDKSWKSRCKKEKQWVVHKKSPIEEEILDIDSTAIHDIYYKYGDGEWHDIPRNQSGFIADSFEYDDLIEKLEKKNMAEIRRENVECTFYRLGDRIERGWNMIEEKRTRLIAVSFRLKQRGN